MNGLTDYPQTAWNTPPTDRWLALCDQLQGYPPAPPQLRVRNLERKWEMVSAYQKSVRRGLKDQALWLVGGFLSFGRGEAKYFWRRICTTVAEDVGYGDPEAMNFAVACVVLYGSVKTPIESMYSTWCFLTEQLCSTQRSRVYCQLSIIEGAIRRGQPVETLTDWEIEIVEALAHPQAMDAKRVWAERNNWRCEGMLHFQHMQFSGVEIGRGPQPRDYRLIADLPDFAYDVHTRIGRAVCARLCAHEPIRQFLADNPSSQEESRAIGMALFFAEGGLIRDGLADSRLSLLEQKYVAASFGWTAVTWLRFVDVLREASDSGVVNVFRERTLADRRYAPLCEPLLL